MNDKIAGEHYKAGWDQADDSRIELYYTLINDLAEQMYVRERCNLKLLIETVAFLNRELVRANEAFNRLHSEIILTATKGLIDRIEELRMIDRKKKPSCKPAARSTLTPDAI